MENQIDKIVSQIFKNEFFCEGVETAKERVIVAFRKKYEELLTEHSPIQAMGILMSQYGTVADAAKLAGYTTKQIASWHGDGEILTKREVVKGFRRARYGIYIASFGVVFLVVSLMNLLLYRNLFWLIQTLLYALIVIGCAIFVYKKGETFRYHHICFDAGAEGSMKKLLDRYFKRMLNSFAVALAGFFLLIYISGIGIWKMGMNWGEIFSLVYSGIFLIELIAYAVIKNVVCTWWLCRAFPAGRRRAMRKYSGCMAVCSVVYWSLCILIVFLVRDKVENLFGILSLFAVFYCILWIIANLTIRQSVVFTNLRLNIRRAAVTGTCILPVSAYQLMQMDRYLLQPYISTIQRAEFVPDWITYNENNGVYTIKTEKEEFRILQLTDIHLGGSVSSALKDYKALTACYKLIQHTKPDFVIVTGDLVFPLGVMSFSFNNTAPVMQFASFMRNLGIPWAFTYGNHDTESLANGSVSEMDTLFQALSFKTSGNLLYPYIQPDITGRNNQLIEIRNADGSLNQALFLLDSNDYIDGVMNQYDYIHDDEVEWYRKQVERLNGEEGRLVSSLLFFHMPLQEYRTAYELYEAGSAEVEYFFGVNNEKMIDKVCCSEYPSSLFRTAKELGSTKAMFCGHDHYNNLSVAYEGIRLTYGMSIDYLAMPGIEEDTEQRGGTLITLYRDSSYDISQVKLTEVEGEIKSDR